MTGIEETQVIKILFSIQVKEFKILLISRLVLSLTRLLCWPYISNILIWSKYFNSSDKFGWRRHRHKYTGHNAFAINDFSEKLLFPGSIYILFMWKHQTYQELPVWVLIVAEYFIRIELISKYIKITNEEANYINQIKTNI